MKTNYEQGKLYETNGQMPNVKRGALVDVYYPDIRTWMVSIEAGSQLVDWKSSSHFILIKDYPF